MAQLCGGCEKGVHTGHWDEVKSDIGVGVGVVGVAVLSIFYVLIKRQKSDKNLAKYFNAHQISIMLKTIEEQLLMALLGMGVLINRNNSKIIILQKLFSPFGPVCLQNSPISPFNYSPK